MKISAILAVGAMIGASAILPVSAESVYGLAFSLDESYLAVGLSTKSATLYKTATGQRVATMGAQADRLVFDKLGARVFLANSQYLQEYNISTKITTAFSGVSGGITGLELSPNGKFLASSSYDGNVRIWSVAKKALKSTIRSDRTGGTYGISISPDNREIFAGGSDGYITVFGTKSGRKLRYSKKNIGGIHDLHKLDGNGALVVLPSFLSLFNPKTLLVESESWVYGYHMDVGGGLVATCDNGDVALVRLPELSTVEVFKIKYGCREVALSQSGKLLAVGDAIGITHLYDAITFKKLRTLK